MCSSDLKADQHAATIMPGFTHLQPAQPVTFGHHLLAYVEMFGRDRGRFADCRRRLNESPLGAAALAGTPYPIDRAMTARALGFDRPMANSLDAVSDRDYVVEFLAAIPSVAWGFIGVVVLNPIIVRTTGAAIGTNVLNGGIIVGLMSVPIIVSIAARSDGRAVRIPGIRPRPSLIAAPPRSGPPSCCGGIVSSRVSRMPQ